MPDLSGRIFVVTGGNGGIGLGMAEGIAASGGSIAIWARNEEKNTAAVQKLEKLGVTAKAYVCDVSSEETVVETMAGTVADFGRIDGLFANAGRPGTGTPFVDLTLTEWQKIMAVNLDGVFLCMREAAKQLISQGSGGSLVAVSSTSAVHGAAGNEAYGTAKTGVTGLVRALAVALARYQIRVNALLPGWTVTELAGPAFANDRFREVTTKRTPVRRWADPSEFREVGAFLADPTQTFHTGQQVCLDGGYTIF
ncbi:MAG: SDR family oxidoreductase [Actinomycetota bacterium]|nr:SDR family oxidoreductase [Actinomycetota bacterium]